MTSVLGGGRGISQATPKQGAFLEHSASVHNILDGVYLRSAVAMQRSQSAVAFIPAAMLCGPRPHHRRATHQQRLLNMSSANLPQRRASQPLRPDDIVSGTVTNLAPYGAFVQLPNTQVGLVHISQISDNFINDISKHLTIGQNLKVRVLSIDQSNGRISLSLKRVIVPTSDAYERAVQLGGDWGHPWGDDEQTKFMDLGPRPPKAPYPWEPDPSLFDRFDQPNSR